MKPIRPRVVIVGIITLLAIYFSVPSIIYLTQPAEVRNDATVLEQKIPPGFPKTHINLGLDLQGGVQLVLGVRLEQALDNKLGRIATDITRWASDEKIPIKTAFVPTDRHGTLRVQMNPGQDFEAIRENFRTRFSDLVFADKEGDNVDFTFRPEQIKATKASALEQAERVIRNRVDKWGVTEPLISRRSDGNIMVQLPGFKDTQKAKELLGRTAQLKFKIVDDQFSGFTPIMSKLPAGVTASGSSLVSENKQQIVDLVAGLIPADRQLLFGEEQIAGGKKTRYTTYVVHATTEIQGDDVIDAFVTLDSSGLDNRPEVSLKFSSIGGKRFEEVTGRNINKRMAIILDDVVESAPNIQTKIAGGQARITLGSNQDYNTVMEEANQLSLVLKSGALPATIDILEQRQVGASLGPELATEGLMGTGLGVLLIFLFMCIYYRRPGMIASAALTLNGLYVFACMACFGFALTLPGIAGFVLGLGIAVDANVLINERIREELRLGKPARKALDLGFSRVFWTVFDSHVTTIIAAIILLETNTSGPIRGFAVTLIIGLVVSLFTALYCSHLFFDVVMRKVHSPAKELEWLGGAVAQKKETFHFNFLRYDVWATGLSMALALVIIVAGFVKGFNWSVDFVGGLEIELAFDERVEASDVRKVLEGAGINHAHLQALGDESKQFMIRLEKEALEAIPASAVTASATSAGQPVDATADASAVGGEEQASEAAATGAKVQAMQDIIKRDLAKYGPKMSRVDYVGPQIGKELRAQGFLSLLYAVLGILGYLALRFDMRFGSGAVLKLIPDTCAMLGFYLVFWRSFDLTSIAALLTGIGYSVNDVIVVFDRIRENSVAHPQREFRENINRSLNETLRRTINTSVVTSLSLVGLLIFGSGSLWNFAAAMTVGIIAATFSSNLVGSSYLLWFDTIRAKFRRRSSAAGSQVTRPA